MIKGFKIRWTNSFLNKKRTRCQSNRMGLTCLFLYTCNITATIQLIFTISFDFCYTITLVTYK